MRTFKQKPETTQQPTSGKSAMPGRPSFAQSREAHSILHLQRTIGNQAVGRLMQFKGEERNAALAGKPAPVSALHTKPTVQCAPGRSRRGSAIQQGLLLRAQKTPYHALKLWGKLNRATRNKLLWFFMTKCGLGFTYYFSAYAKAGGQPVNTVTYSNLTSYTPQYLRKNGYCKWGSFSLARNVFSETWFHYTGSELRTTRWVHGKPSVPPPYIIPGKSISIPSNPVQTYGRVIRKKMNVANPLGDGKGEAVLYHSGVIEVILSQRPRRAMTFISIPGKAGQYHGYSSGGDRVVDPLEDTPSVYTWDSNNLIYKED